MQFDSVYQKWAHLFQDVRESLYFHYIAPKTTILVTELTKALTLENAIDSSLTNCNMNCMFSTDNESDEDGDTS